MLQLEEWHATETDKLKAERRALAKQSKAVELQAGQDKMCVRQASLAFVVFMFSCCYCTTCNCLLGPLVCLYGCVCVCVCVCVLFAV